MARRNLWLLAERAYAFSALLLTERKDIRILQKRDLDDGAELLVEVMKNGKHALRFFGIRVKGCLSLPKLQDADGVFFSNKQSPSVEYHLPFCVFLIDVKDNKGCYRWLSEPNVVEDEPRLAGFEETDWKPLNDKAIKAIVERVDAWYQALRLVAGR